MSRGDEDRGNPREERDEGERGARRNGARAWAHVAGGGGPARHDTDGSSTDGSVGGSLCDAGPAPLWRLAAAYETRSLPAWALRDRRRPAPSPGAGPDAAAGGYAQEARDGLPARGHPGRRRSAGRAARSREPAADRPGGHGQGGGQGAGDRAAPRGQ